MPRTKRRFLEVSPSNYPDNDPDDHVSDPNREEPPSYEPPQPQQQQNLLSSYRMSGGGKSLSRMMNRPGKQLRVMEVDDDDDDDDEDDDEDEEEEEEEDPVKPTVYGGGKHFRPMMGKQLRMPAPQESDESTGSSEEEDDDEEEVEEEQPPQQLPTRQEPAAVVAPRGGGKSFMNMRSGGKQLRTIVQTQSDDEEEEDEEDEESEDDEDSANGHVQKEVEQQPFVVPHRPLGGKFFRPQPNTYNDDEDMDSEDSDEDQNEKMNQQESAKKTNEKEVEEKIIESVTEEKSYENKDKEKIETNEKEEEQEERDPITEAPKKVTVSTKKVTKAVAAAVKKPAIKKGNTTARPSRKAVAKKPVSEESNSSDGDDDEIENAVKDDNDDEDDDELDLDELDESKLIKDEADQRYLDSLPEIERESILAQRYEKLKDEMDMKKVLRENKRKERELKKSSGSNQTAVKQKGAAIKKTEVKASKQKPDVSPKRNKVESMKSKIASSSNASSDEDEDEDSQDDDEEYKEDENESMPMRSKKDSKAPDTSKDAELASALVSRSSRNRDAKGVKGKQAAARAAIRENRAAAKVAEQQKRKSQQNDSVEESDLDYGDDLEDSDEDYEEDKPWMNKKGSLAVSVGNLKSTVPELKSSQDREDKEEYGEHFDEGLGPKVAEANFADYKAVTIPRRRLSRWCNEPYFEQAVIDFYVRVSLGRDPTTQKALYRFCKIKAVKECGEYELNGEEGKPPVKTNKRLVLSVGNSSKEKSMSLISDSAPQDSEIEEYLNLLKSQRAWSEVLSKKMAMKMKNAQEKLVTHYQYTEEDIARSILSRKSMTKTITNLGAEKLRVSIAVQAAKQALDDAERKVQECHRKYVEASDDDKDKLEEEMIQLQDTVKACESELDMRLEEERKVLSAEENRKIRMKQSTKVQNWVRVNEKAKAANKAADVEAYKIELEKTLAGGKGKDFDPYARRKMKPQILWEVGQDSQKEPDKALTSTEVKEAESANVLNGKEDGKVDQGNSARENEIDPSASRKSKLVDQIHDLTIDEELLARSNFGLSFGSSSKRMNVIGRVRKGLSLDDYLLKKATGAL